MPDTPHFNVDLSRHGNNSNWLSSVYLLQNDPDEPPYRFNRGYIRFQRAFGYSRTLRYVIRTVKPRSPQRSIYPAIICVAKWSSKRGSRPLRISETGEPPLRAKVTRDPELYSHTRWQATFSYRLTVSTCFTCPRDLLLSSFREKGDPTDCHYFAGIHRRFLTNWAQNLPGFSTRVVWRRDSQRRFRSRCVQKSKFENRGRRFLEQAIPRLTVVFHHRTIL